MEGKMSTIFGERYNGIDLYNYMINRKGNSRLIKLWNEYVYNVLLVNGRKMNEQELRDYLTEISNYATKSNVDGVFGKYFRYFKNLLHLGPNVDPQTFAANPDLQYRDKETQTLKWVKGKTLMETGNNYLTFIEHFQISVKKWFALMQFTPNKNQPSIEQYLKSPDYWVTNGSSNVKIKSKIFESTKASNALLSYEELKDLFLRTSSERITVSGKHETKYRTVAGSDMSMYLKQNYISLFLESTLKSHQHATAFMDANKLQLVYENIAKDLKGDNIYFASDIDSFDHNVSKKMINIIFSELKTYLIKHQSPEEVIYAMDLIIEQYKKPAILKTDGVGRKYIKADKGLMSGWRFTAWFGSIVSWCYTFMLNGMTLDGLTNFYTQGDDSIVGIDSMNRLERIIKNIDFYKIPINPRKSSVSFPGDLRATDYLNRTIMKEGEEVYITGVPARLISKICWQSDWKSGGNRKDQIGRILNLHTTLARRMRMKVDDLIMFRDMAGATKWRIKDLKIICNIAVALGGYSYPNAVYDKKVVWDLEKENDLDKIIIPDSSVIASYSNAKKWITSRLTPKRNIENVKYKFENNKVIWAKHITRRVAKLSVREGWFAPETYQEYRNEMLGALSKEEMRIMWRLKYNQGLSLMKHFSSNLILKLLKSNTVSSTIMNYQISSLGLVRIRNYLDGWIMDNLFMRPNSGLNTLRKLQITFSNRYRSWFTPSKIKWED